MSGLTRFQARRGVSSDWVSSNPILADGELGLEKAGSGYMLKLGNGSDPWSTLGYLIVPSSGGGGGGSLPGYYNVKDYGAIGNGTTDDTSAVAAANAAAHAAGGVVFFPPGLYLISSQIAVTSLKVSWIGVGSKSVVLKSSVNGAMLKWNMGPFGGTVPTSSGRLIGVTIDGTIAGTNGQGLEWGDNVNGFIDDVVIQNFSGASQIGMYACNRTDYTEGTHIGQLTFVNCKNNLKFDVLTGANSNSFAYWCVNQIRFIALNSGQTGLVVTNAALIYDAVRFGLEGNLAAGATFGTITGNSGANGFAAGTTAITGNISFVAEQTGGSPGSATGLVLSNFATLDAQGLIDFSGNLLQSSLSSSTFNFNGICRAPGLGWHGERPALVNSGAWPIHGGSTPNYTNSWINSGASVAFWQDSSGAIHLQGAVHSGSANTSAFTLPVGYRPSQDTAFMTASSTTSPAVVKVKTNGNVECSDPTYTSLAGVVFLPI